jgi:myo-inositol-1(or 4)-monophosphatase
LSFQSPLIQVMITTARKACKGVGRDFGEVEALQVSRKGPADFVTMTDRRVEEALREELLRVRPGYSFWGEETGLLEGTDKTHRWIVDPLDGTTNFIHAIPHFACSVALEREGEIVAGVIYNPITSETYWAEKGKGAFLNDKKLRVSGRQRLDECLIGTGAPFVGKPGHALFLKELHQIMQRTAGIRRLGACSLDLCMVASGQYDGFWERGLKAWDLAAGQLMVTEAGGAVRSLDQGSSLETGTILAGNAYMVQALGSLIDGLA